MNRLLSISALALLLASSLRARADVAPDPCETLAVGDACETFNGNPGTCKDAGGYLTCEETPATTASSSATGTGGGGTGGAGSGGSDGAGGEEPTEGGSGEDEGGCAISPAQRDGAAGFGFVALAALGFAVARRRSRG